MNEHQARDEVPGAESYGGMSALDLPGTSSLPSIQEIQLVLRTSRSTRRPSRVRALMVASVAVAAGVVGLAAPTPAPAAMDMFLEVNGIPGESRDAVHKDKIDVLAWSWGVSRSTQTRTRPAAARQDTLEVTKYIDRATPLLYNRAFTGGVTTTAKLIIRKAGTNPLEFLTMCMEEVRVLSVESGGSGGEDRLTEKVALSADRVAMRYRPQNADGTAGTAVTAIFDFARNVATLNVTGC